MTSWQMLLIPRTTEWLSFRWEAGFFARLSQLLAATQTPEAAVSPEEIGLQWQQLVCTDRPGLQRVEDLFECQLKLIAGSEPEVVLRGDYSQIPGVGQGWSAGRLVIEGAAGNFLGERMTGGKILCQGDAGNGVGRGMSGGQIQIQGNVGQDVGGPLPGELKGMTGGEIFIQGTAGAGVGTRMRRGTIAVRKAVGTGAGQEMLAGTLVISGPPAGAVGVGMKRGTIVLLGDQLNTSSLLGAHADRAVTYQPTFLRLLLKHLQQAAPSAILDDCQEAWFERASGDMLEGGRGEILIRRPHFPPGSGTV